jgi:SHO1 osmosensor
MMHFLYSTWSTANTRQLVWLLAFAALIVVFVETKEKDSLPSNFVWWSIAYDLFVILGVFTIVASDTIHTYHVALTAYCSAGMALTSIAVNSLIHSSEAAKQASAAGFILLAMLMVCTTVSAMRGIFC